MRTLLLWLVAVSPRIDELPMAGSEAVWGISLGDRRAVKHRCSLWLTAADDAKLAGAVEGCLVLCFCSSTF